MKYIKLMIIFATVLGLTGCSSYIPPSSGPTATITGAGGTFQNALTCSKVQNLSVDKANKIRAGKLATFYVYDATMPCPVYAFSFTPKANNNYQSIYKVTSEKKQSCYFELRNLTTNKPVYFISRKFHINLLGNTTFGILGKASYCTDKLAGK